VTNTNLASILHRLRDIAFDRSKIAILGYHSWRGVKTWPKISVAWLGCTNVTDRRHTDGRTMTL